MKREGWLDDLPKLYGRIPALPMLQREVTNSMVNKQDMDEARGIARLAERPAGTSAAGKIPPFWELGRRLIHECHNAMRDDRGLQVTCNNLIGATRFKTFDGARLMRAKCPNKHCGGVDSWEHFIQCYGVLQMTGKPRDEKVNYLVALCHRIRTENPIRPSPTVIPYRGNQGQRSSPIRRRGCDPWHSSS